MFIQGWLSRWEGGRVAAGSRWHTVAMIVGLLADRDSVSDLLLAFEDFIPRFFPFRFFFFLFLNNYVGIAEFSVIVNSENIFWKLARTFGGLAWKRFDIVVGCHPSGLSFYGNWQVIQPDSHTTINIVYILPTPTPPPTSKSMLLLLAPSTPLYMHDSFLHFSMLLTKFIQRN